MKLFKDLQDQGIIENPLKNPKGGYFDNSKPNGVKVIVSRINNDPLQYGYEIIAPNEGPKEILAIDFSDYYDACPGPIYLSSTAANTDGKFMLVGLEMSLISKL